MLVVYGDGYEYEVERDERAQFLRASKLERFRIEQAKQAKQQTIKKRKMEVNEDSSNTESEDDDYMEELAEKVIYK